MHGAHKCDASKHHDNLVLPKESDEKSPLIYSVYAGMTIRLTAVASEDFVSPRAQRHGRSFGSSPRHEDLSNTRPGCNVAGRCACFRFACDDVAANVHPLPPTTSGDDLSCTTPHGCWCHGGRGRCFLGVILRSARFDGHDRTGLVCG